MKDSSPMETAFREFREESGGLLEKKDVKQLKGLVGRSNSLLLWMSSGGYALYVILLPESFKGNAQGVSPAWS